MLHKYMPYYCEENIYLLARQFLENAEAVSGAYPEFGVESVWVVFITNEEQSCTFLSQKSAQPGGPVSWDYHVVLLTQGRACAAIWDFDTRLDFPCEASDYLDRTFPENAPEEQKPRFRIIPAARISREFSSDRRHMRTADGIWLKPPPSWPCLRGHNAGSPHELESILDLDDGRWGPVDQLVTVRENFAHGLV